MGRLEATGIAYDASFEAISEPAARGRFFELHRPQSEAAWCAEFSRLAYCDDVKTLRAVLERIGFQLLARPVDRVGLQGFVAQGPDFGILVFRGSDAPGDWLNNFDAAQADWPPRLQPPAGSRLARGRRRA